MFTPFKYRLRAGANGLAQMSSYVLSGLAWLRLESPKTGLVASLIVLPLTKPGSALAHLMPQHDWSLRLCARGESGGAKNQAACLSIFLFEPVNKIGIMMTEQFRL